MWNCNDLVPGHELPGRLGQSEQVYYHDGLASPHFTISHDLEVNGCFPVVLFRYT
jgi:hypothetical protein